MLHKRSIKEKLLKGGAWAFVGKLVTALSGLVISALLARLLSSEEMGAYFLAFSLVSFMAVLAQLGLTQSIVRLVAESMATDHPERARLSVIWSLRIAALAICSISSLFAIGGGVWIADHFFHSEILSQAVGLIALWTIIIAFQQLMAEIYRGFHDIRLATTFGGLFTGLLSMVIFFMLWSLQGQGDLNQIIIISILAGGSSLVLSSLILWKKISILASPLGDEISALEIVHLSWPLWVSNLMVFVVLQADVWVVGYFLGDTDVALYGAVSRMVTLLLITNTILYSIMPPIITEMHAKKENKGLQAVLCSSALGNCILVLPVFVIYIFFSGDILSVVFGQFYFQAGDLLTLLSIGFFFNLLTGMRGITLMMTGHQKVQMGISIISGILNIVFCSIGAIYMGVLGVAIGAMVGMIISCLLELIAVKRLLGIWTIATPQYWKEFKESI